MRLKPVSPISMTVSRVIKLPRFKGRLAARPVYIYTPPGYENDPEKDYPVLYMHDGQNVFEAFKEDSFNGTTWRADRAADRLIARGAIEPLLIVGVANGRERRMAEYLPPYMTFRPKFRDPAGREAPAEVPGKADRTARYYIADVDRYIRANYRVKAGRNARATCGSSMGGLFSTYLAWEFPEFARRHALVSPSYWVTRNQEGSLEILDRIAAGPKPDLRIWIDSGTTDIVGKGNDGMLTTRDAQQIMQDIGFTPGRDFHYFLDEGGDHSEGTWARRMPNILKFLFPKKDAE